MFDIGFSEIVVIGVVALVVIGPERLPKTARTLGHLFGRLQRYVSEVKADISREMELDELRKLQSEVQSAARELETSVSQAAQSVETGVRSIESQLNDAGTAATASGDGAAHAETLASASPPPQTPAVPTAAPSAAATAADVATTPPAESPRQAALPGFDRI